MIDIKKFKLINHGKGGIEIIGKESMMLSSGVSVIDDIKRTRRLILSDEIILEIQKLKYYFFNLTGHWMPPFNNYYDRHSHELKDMIYDDEGRIKQGQEMLRNLWSRTTITGISFTNGGFVLTGEINTVENKKIVINTPFISADDDIGFFSDAIEKLQEIIEEIVKFLSSKYLPEYKPSDVLSKEEMEGVDEDRLAQMVLEKLADKGMIILCNEESIPAIEQGEGKTTISSNTKNIDGDNLDIAEEHTDDELNEGTYGDDLDPRDKIIAETAETINIFGQPAGVTDEAEQAELGTDLTAHEYSEEANVTDFSVTEDKGNNGQDESWS